MHTFAVGDVVRDAAGYNKLGGEQGTVMGRQNGYNIVSISYVDSVGKTQTREVYARGKYLVAEARSGAAAPIAAHGDVAKDAPGYSTMEVEGSTHTKRGNGCNDISISHAEARGKSQEKVMVSESRAGDAASIAENVVSGARGDRNEKSPQALIVTAANGAPSAPAKQDVKAASLSLSPLTRSAKRKNDCLCKWGKKEDLDDCLCKWGKEEDLAEQCFASKRPTVCIHERR